jgi:hypothetical protein
VAAVGSLVRANGSSQEKKMNRMKANITTACHVLAASLLIAATSALQASPSMVPPQAQYQGRSYAEWSAAWWQWAVSLPVAGHPSLDETGADAAAGQTGSVFFLTSVFNASGTVVRNITVSPSTALFIPILNADCSNVEPPPFFGANETEMRANVIALIDATSGIYLEIDGEAVANLGAYRFDSPLFGFTLPDPNILGVPGGGPGLAVADGYYAMLHPLSPGEHMIRFGGTFDDFGFSLNATYHVTVH